jgi:hypothetical protein
MDLDVFSAGFFDKNVGVAPRSCISYIKFGSFLRCGPVSSKFDVLFAALTVKVGIPTAGCGTKTVIARHMKKDASSE